MVKYVPKRDYSANLVANYKFNETSGTTCIDAKGAYNGTYTGTNIVAGIDGNARSFDGDDCIVFANSVIPLGKKSIRFKIKISESEKSTTSRYRILCNYNGTNGYNCSIEKSGYFTFQYFNSGSVLYQGGFYFTEYFNDYWHDILIINDGSNLKIYIDNLVTPVSVSSAYINEIQGGNFQIGRFPVNSTEYFKGSLDDLEIYNEAVEFKLPEKYLINQNSKYYSIKSNFYELGVPIDNATLEAWYDKYGADDLISITASSTSREMPMTLLDETTGIWKTDFQLDANLITDSVELVDIDDNKAIKHNSPTYKIYDDYLGTEFNINMLKK